MNAPQLQQIVQLARSLPMEDQVPLAFEKRVMAHLRSRGPVDLWAAWSQVMWRAAFACVTIAVCFGAAAIYQEDTGPEFVEGDLEQVVFAPIQAEGEVW